MSNIRQKVSSVESLGLDRLTRNDEEEGRNIVRVFHPDDVLMGRGVARNEHTGNVRYRDIVARHKEEYLATKKRAHKDIIARKVQKAVESNGGRFLRSAYGLSGGNEHLYIVEDRSIVLEKVKQALRFVGREVKDQIRQRTSDDGEAPSLPPPAIRTKADSKQTSSTAKASKQSSVASSEKQPSEASTESQSLIETSLSQALLQRRSLLDAMQQSHDDHQLMPVSAPAAATTGSSAFAQVGELSFGTTYQIPTRIHPERRISALLDSIRAPDHFFDASRQRSGPVLTSHIPLLNYDSNLLSLMLTGSGGGRIAHSPMVAAYPSLCASSLQSMLALSLPHRQDISTTLSSHYPSASGWLNTTSDSDPALPVGLPPMNESQIQMILTLLNSRHNIE